MVAAVLDLDGERAARASAAAGDPLDQAFELIRTHVGGLEPADALARISRYRAGLSALETSVIKRVNAETGSDRASKRLLNDGKTSRVKIAKAAARAEAAAANPDLVDKMADGDLSEEQVDVIADTAAKTDGAAAVDADFIDEVADVDPDQARNVAAKFIADRANKDGTQTEHDRQRAQRRAARYLSKRSGLWAINLGGDAVATKNMWADIVARADELYEADGGRDVPAGLHPRSYEQCLFDAAHELICGVTTTPTGVKHEPRHKNATSGRSGRPQIFVALTLDQYLGIDRAAMAEQIGLGLIPDTVLADYLEHADIMGLLYDRNGQPLWLARTKRHASLMQRYALIARDKACVMCGADHTRCQVHHTMPWNAPGKGETNIDELVLLCGRCHRQLHADNHTIYQDTKGTWRTRPATPTETPPKRVDHPQRE